MPLPLRVQIDLSRVVRGRIKDFGVRMGRRRSAVLLLLGVCALAALAAPARAQGKAAKTGTSQPGTIQPQSIGTAGALVIDPAYQQISEPANTDRYYSFTVSDTGTAGTNANFSAVCSGNVSNCSVSASTGYIATQNSILITVSYRVGLPGSASVGLHATSGNNNATDGTLAITIPGAPPVVSTSDATVWMAERWGNSYSSFHVKNTGNVAVTYSLQAACGGNIVAGSCTVGSSNPTPSIAPNQSVDVTVNFTTGAGSGGNGTATLTATSPYAQSSSASITVVPLSEDVSVSAAAAPPAPRPSGSASYGFTVSAVGSNTSPIPYTLSTTCTGALSCPATPSPSSVTITPGSPAGASVTATAASNLAGGSGTVTLTATYTNSLNQTYTNSATTTVTVPDVRTYTPQATPDADSVTYNEANVSTNYVFKVRNAGNTAAQYQLSVPTCMGTLSGCALRTNPIVVNPGQTLDVPVDFSTQGVGTTTHIALHATTTANSGQVFADDGSVQVIPLAATVQVINAGGAPSIQTNRSETYAFTVTNTGNEDNITYTLQVTGCSAPVTACAAPANVVLNHGQSKTVSVSYQTQGTTGQGSITLRAYVQFVHLYESSSIGYINVQSRLGVSTAFMNNDDQDMDLCATSCFAATAAHSTAPFFTLGAARSITLLYHGDRAFPRPFVYADVTIASPLTSVQSYILEVKRNGADLPFTNGETQLAFQGTSTPWNTSRLAGQLDMSSYPTGVYAVSLVVTATYVGGGSEVTSTPTQVIVVNTNTSAVAQSWSVAGVQRLAYQPEIPGYLIYDGAGSAVFFAGSGSTAADQSTLTLSSGVWTRSYLDGTRVNFDANGLMTVIIDRTGRQTQFGYDASGRLATVFEPMRAAGGTATPYWSLTYLPNGGLSSITEAGTSEPRTTAITLDGAGRIAAITDPDGGSDRYGYDVQGRLNSLTDRRGNTTQYVYAPSWKLAQVVMPAVPIDAGAGTTSIQQPVVTYRDWQSVGVPTDSTAAHAATLYLASNPTGTLISPTFDTTKVAVNRWGQPVQITDALGHTVAIERSGTYPTVVHHYDGSVDSAAYTNGLVTWMREAGHGIARIRYGVFAQPDSVWGGGSAAQRIFLNPTNGLVDSVRHAGPTPNVSHFTYDAMGRVLTATDEVGHIVQYAYDPTWGSVLAFTDANGVTPFVNNFDPHGRTTNQIWTAKKQANVRYDLMNRPDSIFRGIAPDSVIRIGYDSALATSLTDRNGNTTIAAYNAIGWLTSRCDPLAHCMQYRYDRSGRVTGVTNRRGLQLAMSYDRLGRLTSKSGDSTTTDTFSYASDDRGVVAQNAFETDSLRIVPGTSTRGVADTTVTIVDGVRFQVLHGDLTSGAGVDSTIITSSALGVTFRKRYLYADTALGIITSFGDGFNTTSYSYTGDWLQSASSNVTGTRNTGFLRTHAAEYTQFTLSSLTELSRSEHYDALERIDQIFTFRPTRSDDGGSFAFDSAGRLAQAQKQAGCATLSSGLFGLARGNCASYALQHSYLYDGEGNRVSDIPYGTYSTFGPGNQIQTYGSVVFDHDLDGNIRHRRDDATGAEAWYSWSSDGRLTDVTIQPAGQAAYTVHYDYNPFGEPVHQVVSGSSDRVWLRDRGQLLGEFDAANGYQRIAEYLYTGAVDEPYGIITGGTTPTAIHYVEYDEGGNVIGTHDGGTVTMNVTGYDTWGKPNLSVGTIGSLFWKGLQLDQYSGLYYMRARWYDPELGRFLSEDPAGFAGGVNPYVFDGNDPINGSDPTGLWGGWGGASAIPGCGLYCQFASGVLRPSDADKHGIPRHASTFGNPGNTHPVLYHHEGIENVSSDFLLLFGGLELKAGEIAVGATEKVVIGESMEARVIPYAKEIGADWYKARPWAREANWARNNARWLKRQMDAGKEIIDIGIDPTRLDRSPWYALEREILRKAGYPITTP